MKKVPHRQDSSKSALSPEHIVKIAVTIGDREGITAVSMRRLARELSVTPMALYWHFEDKDRLLDAMAETVIADGEFDDVPNDGWDQRLRGVLTTLVGLLHQHPWMGRLVIERVVPLPRYLTALEIMLDSVRKAGLSPHDGAVLTQQAVQAVVALAEHEPGPGSKPASGRLAMRDYLGNLPPEQYPNIRGAAGPLTGQLSLDDYYRLGIDTIVLGIGAIAHQPARRRRRSAGAEEPLAAD